MTKRKSKSGNKQQPEEHDTSFLLESPPVARSRRLNEYVLPCILFLIITIGGFTVGCFCYQQQSTIDQLSESYTALQMRITKFQQIVEIGDARLSSGLSVEQRILALERANEQAQEKVKVAMATSDSLKNTDIHSQVWSLQSEIDSRLAEMQQVSVSTASLEAMIRNQSKELEVVKQSIGATLSSSPAITVSVAGLTSALALTTSKLNEQEATMDNLTAQLERQASEMKEMKVSLDLHQVVLQTNNQGVIEIKEQLKSEQAKRALALEEKLFSVKKILDEQYFSSQLLHANLNAQLQSFSSQLLIEDELSSVSEESQPDQEDTAPEDDVSFSQENVLSMKKEQQNEDEEMEEEKEEEEVGDDEEEGEEDEEYEKENGVEAAMEEQEVQQEVLEEEEHKEKPIEQESELEVAQEPIESPGVDEFSEEQTEEHEGDDSEETAEEKDTEYKLEEDTLEKELEEDDSQELDEDFEDEEPLDIEIDGLDS